MEKFYLKVDAESPDGEVVKCDASINIACSSTMAVSVMVSILKGDTALKKIFLEALMVAFSGKEISEAISSKEYNNHIKEEDNDVDL